MVTVVPDPIGFEQSGSETRKFMLDHDDIENVSDSTNFGKNEVNKLFF